MLSPNFGALVISLDFELYWGVRDFIVSNDQYRKNLIGEYKAIPAMLELFEQFEIGATWATVGFLFASSSDELKRFKPNVLPKYENPNLSPYNENFERDSRGLSIYYAPELVNLIKSTPRQEIATHTFSHYYCLEKGQDKEAFGADIESAIAIAKEKSINLKSIVFPRNQHNPNYDNVLLKSGITSYRGNQKSWMYQFDGKTQFNPIYRVARLADTYANISGLNTTKWEGVSSNGLKNIPASIFLRPVSSKESKLQNLQFRRIRRSLEFAAKNKQIFHLWWHPHNFGVNLEENLSFLKRIFEVYRNLNEKYGMRSLNMAQTVETIEGI